MFFLRFQHTIGCFKPDESPSISPAHARLVLLTRPLLECCLLTQVRRGLPLDARGVRLQGEGYSWIVPNPPSHVADLKVMALLCDQPRFIQIPEADSVLQTTLHAQ